MSWDMYLNYLISQTNDASGTPHADKGCIIGIDGGAKLTTDDHANAFKLSTTEAANIARCFKSKDFTAFMTSGIRAEGVKYQFLGEISRNIVYGKNKDNGSITLQSSKTVIVIAHCPEGKQLHYANKGVAAIADFLVSLGM